jgi:hypothetical protein
MRPPLLHPVFTMNAERDATRGVSFFQSRDVHAVMEATEPLREQGYALGEVKFNYPPQPGSTPNHASIDTSSCRKQDLLVGGTRPGALDSVQGGRRRIRRAFTDLDDEIVAEWNPFLPIIGGSHVCIHPDVAAMLPPGYEDRFDMFFYQIGKSALYKTRRANGEKKPHRPPHGEASTPAFLLRVPKLAKRDVGYLGFWGMNGRATLGWAYLLRHRFPHLVQEPSFVMAELSGMGTSTRPLDLRWVLDWNVEILIQLPLSRPDAKRSRKAAAR